MQRHAPSFIASPAALDNQSAYFLPIIQIKSFFILDICFLANELKFIQFNWILISLPNTEFLTFSYTFIKSNPLMRNIVVLIEFFCI